MNLEEGRTLAWSNQRGSMEISVKKNLKIYRRTVLFFSRLHFYFVILSLFIFGWAVFSLLCVGFLWLR